MARQYNHTDVTFERTITQQQIVTVATPVGLSDGIAQQMAEELAGTRLKSTQWKTMDGDNNPRIVGNGAGPSA